MKKIRLTERDLTRLVKRVLNEQELYKNKTINLYKDKENKNFLMRVTIDQLEDSDGTSYAWYETLTPKGDLKVYCAKDGIEFKTDGGGGTISTLASTASKITVYNKGFEGAVKKQMCTTNTKGVTVPKADFALTQPQTQQMGSGTLAERDLTRIIKRIINEDNEEMESNSRPSVEINYLDGDTDVVNLSSILVGDLIELIGDNYAGMYVDEDSGNLVIDVVKWPHDLI